MQAIRKQDPEPDFLETQTVAIGVDAETDAASARLVLLTLVRPSSLYRRRGKRLLDAVLGAALLVCALPLLLAVGLAVLAASGWPVLYASERVGLGGRPFRMQKFRTMISDADRVIERWRETRLDLADEYGKNFKVKDDPRITPLGRLLRKTSLDELPQLWNVVRGDMSLVGPRPVPGKEMEDQYGAMTGQVLSVRPGMTGLWQINGRSRTTYEERVRMDLTYAQDLSLLGDVKVLLKTNAAVFRTNEAA